MNGIRGPGLGRLGNVPVVTLATSRSDVQDNGVRVDVSTSLGGGGDTTEILINYLGDGYPAGMEVGGGIGGGGWM